MIDVVWVFDFVLVVSRQEEKSLVNRVSSPFGPRQSIHRSDLTLGQLPRPITGATAAAAIFTTFWRRSGVDIGGVFDKVGTISRLPGEIEIFEIPC